MLIFDDELDTSKVIIEESDVEESHEHESHKAHSHSSHEEAHSHHSNESHEDDDYSDLGIDEHEEYVVRMNKTERQQHIALFISVTILVITGFASKFQWGFVSEGVRTITHKLFGSILLLVTVWSYLYMAITKDGRRYFKEMIPRIKDVTDAVYNIAYMIGFAKEPPKTEWFDYKEKVEWWALQAGNFLIGSTGIILWFGKNWSFSTNFIAEIAKTIHGMEAVLATGAIVVWHFYSIHFKPGQFPMNRTWIDGKMSLHHLKDEHRMVYDRYMAERRKAMQEGRK